MERTLGVRLFDRKPQGIEPTIYGHALLKWCDIVLEDVRDAVREIRGLADPGTGEVRVGGPEPMVEGLLPVAIGQLSREYPNMIFNVTMAPSPTQRLDELRRRKLDLIVGRLPLQHAHDDLDLEPLFEDPLLVVAAKDSCWARKRKPNLAELAEEAWVLPQPQTSIGSFVREAFRASGADVPRRGTVCASLNFSFMLIATGHFLGLFPRSLLHFSGSRFPVKVLPLTLPIAPPPAGIVTLRNRYAHPATLLLIERLRLLAKPLAAQTVVPPTSAQRPR
jgi:DNA-binding transcriptional LysR family regulator